MRWIPTRKWFALLVTGRWARRQWSAHNATWNSPWQMLRYRLLAPTNQLVEQPIEQRSCVPMSRRETLDKGERRRGHG